MNYACYLRKKFSEVRSFSKDYAWIQANRPSLKSKYYGEYIAVVDQKVVAHDESYLTMLSGLKKFGPKKYNRAAIEDMRDRTLLLVSV